MKLSDMTLLKEQAFIDGAWVGADNGGRFNVTNPIDNSLVASVPGMGAGETRRAIDAAQRALAAWSARSAKHRAGLLRKWYELVIAHQDDLALLMTCEQGKPLAEARGEVMYGASFIEWFAEEAKRAYGELVPAPTEDRRLVVMKQPVGVVAAITPWNFPVAMITRKAAPALAAGCTMVLKPASETPLSALALAALAERAGIPPGVFNVVTAERSGGVGEELTGNPAVRKLTFTGSTRVGKQLMAQCAGTVKKLSLELGGNAPFIVFDDADIDAAVRGAVASKYRNAGQTCVCANRFLVQDGIYDEFARRLAQAANALKPGDGRENGVNLGPLIHARAAGNTHQLVEEAVADGASVLAGGDYVPGATSLYQATVLADVRPEMRVAQEEIFGPVAPLIRFSTEEEAIRLANDTPYGLAAYFYTRDLQRSWRVSERLEYGMVGLNEGLISNEMAPFGGIKESGLGREGSRHGLDEYMELKYVCVGGMA
ncbi:NAD-dependent succinate-semialdehyde dehydrogenase [Noviherbaspirillum denitrificans]|uniref:NAD-dependent succinate-semialdehyde dehydrogenase n=1 Tax=Noviherbaspirillum denitrificans TaxID=1968433 RepID=A0A254T8N9_9BURK|nr:NAD-dependent succinate-semialdehyde dehydrogenase [Noviherbaspirillum denitrificans]OWW19004.1 NAD-dependent succinate-semialdehyde dehydrogenase [Noviherbaspirillum denitrificans]